jgi:putative ABC transport system substrate-binding protein
MIDRRTFISGLMGGLLAAPLAVEAQQPARTYRIGFLALVPGDDVRLVGPFKERLRELGYVEGKNFILDYRSADGHHERLTALATELAEAKPDVLIAGTGTLTALALKQATTTMPIVFASVGDPVGAGVVASLARPGANITGLTGQSADIAAKRFQLLRELIPHSRVIAVLMNPATPFALISLKQTQAAADLAQVRLVVFEVRSRDQVTDMVKAAVSSGAAGLIVFSDPLTYEARQQISDLVANLRLPTLYGHRAHAEAGGLVSYGASRRIMYRRAADYVDKILKGAKPADLPVEQPTKFELIINLKTAQALGLTIPPSLLQRADQVIE